MNNLSETIHNSGIVRWYPMRIFHSSIKRQHDLQVELDKEEMVKETYIPQKLIDAETEKYAPALVNYIFVRIAKDGLRELKGMPRFDHLRYVMKAECDDKFNTVYEIAHITDQEMDNFRQVVNNANDQILFVQNNEFAMRPGQKVRITDGVFKNTEGTVKSIKKHLCVIVTLGSVMAVAITGIHRKFLQPID